MPTQYLTGKTLFCLHIISQHKQYNPHTTALTYCVEICLNKERKFLSQNQGKERQLLVINVTSRFRQSKHPNKTSSSFLEDLLTAFLKLTSALLLICKTSHVWQLVVFLKKQSKTKNLKNDVIKLHHQLKQFEL